MQAGLNNCSVPIIAISSYKNLSRPLIISVLLIGIAN